MSEAIALAKETLQAALEAFDEQQPDAGMEAPTKRDLMAAAERVKGDAGKGALRKKARGAQRAAHCRRCRRCRRRRCACSPLCAPVFNP